MKTRIAVLFGGMSTEHEISVISAIQAIGSMDTEKYDIIPVYMTKKNEMYIGEDVGKIESYKDIPGLLKKSERVTFVNEDDKILLVGLEKKKAFSKRTEIEIDMAFPIVHGTNVEDGTLAGYLKTLRIPFVGCDVTSSALGMDKFSSKAVLKECGIPVLDGFTYTTKDYKEIEDLMDRIEKTVGYPVIVKPYNLGSSVGISVAHDRAELKNSVDNAFLYTNKIITEHAITRLREINCAVLGDEDDAEASEIEEPMHSKDILSYEDKYMSNAKGGKSKGMASVSRKIPAEVSPEMREKIRDIAVKSFKILGCSGCARIDFMIDEETNELYCNEINTIPGSLAFYLWEPIGVPYKELLDRMIEIALKQERQRKALTFSFDTNILSMDSLKGLKGAKK